jgi:hypothetical protein
MPPTVKSGNVSNKQSNEQIKQIMSNYTYTPPALVEEDQKQFQSGGGNSYNYNAANLARQMEAANAKKKEVEEQQRIAEEQRQKQLQWDKAEQEYNDQNRAQVDKRLAAQEKATQAQLNKSMNNAYTYSPYGYDPTTGAPLNKSGYVNTPVSQPQAQMIVSQPDVNQQRQVYDINNYRTDKYYQDSIAQQKKDVTYVLQQPQQQQPLKAEAERQPATGYLTPQQLALLGRVSSGGAGYNVGAELLPQAPVVQRQTINGANYMTPQQLAGLNMKQGQVPVKNADLFDTVANSPQRGAGQTIQDYQYMKQTGEQQQGSVNNLWRSTAQTADTTGGETNLPYGAKVVPSQDGKSKVTLLPYKKGGYFIEDLQDLGMKAKDNWRKDQFGYETQGQPYFEGYYYNRQDGKYYPVNYDKARYAIEKGADSAYDTWAYKGYNPDMAEYYKMFGTYYGYTPSWRTTAFANASGAGKSGGGSYSWNTGSGSGNSGNNANSNQQEQRRYYNDFVTWTP